MKGWCCLCSAIARRRALCNFPDLTHRTQPIPFVPHRDSIHGASYSEKYFDGDTCDAAYNKNVEYLRHTYFWWLYLGALPFFTVLLRLTVMEDRPLAEALTVTHIIHNVVRTHLRA